MSSKKSVTAVFDIGKTNKKFFLFDASLSIIETRNTKIDEIKDDDGYPCDDLDALSNWVKETAQDAIAHTTINFKAINISAYGATLVHTGSDGKPATPLYNYLKPYPEELLEELYRKYGRREHFLLETASPPLGMLNSGLQLYWLKKRKPALFQKISTTFHLPQYISYLLTGQKASEKTSIGCHTCMWNFREGKYHRWLEDEDMLKLLPDIKPVTKSYETVIGESHIKTGIGVHDSSSALVPYLRVFDDPFLLLSTGTWSVAMNPFSVEPLTFEELKRDCLNYMNIYGKPVKASRFMLGGEYSHQLKKLGDYFGKNPEKPDCDFDPVMIQKLADEMNSKRKLTLEKGNMSGPFPANDDHVWDLSRFSSYKEAVHQCLLDLAAIQVESIKLAVGNSNIKQIIVTGGFAKNYFFCRLLATMLPQKKIYTAVLREASALGAALLMEDQKNSKILLKEKLELTLQNPFENVHIEGYTWKSNRGKTD